MGSINIGRLILGGIIAGIVGNILGFVVDAVILAPRWSASMKALGKSEFTGSQTVAFTIIGLVYGLLMMWLYAAIRPRFGPGPKTAVYAGLAAWAIGTLLPNVSLMGVAGLFPSNLTATTTAAGIAESVIACAGRCGLVQRGHGGDAIAGGTCLKANIYRIVSGARSGDGRNSATSR